MHSPFMLYDIKGCSHCLPTFWGSELAGDEHNRWQEGECVMLFMAQLEKMSLFLGLDTASQMLFITKALLKKNL